MCLAFWAAVSAYKSGALLIHCRSRFMEREPCAGYAEAGNSAAVSASKSFCSASVLLRSLLLGVQTAWFSQVRHQIDLCVHVHPCPDSRHVSEFVLPSCSWRHINPKGVYRAQTSSATVPKAVWCDRMCSIFSPVWKLKGLFDFLPFYWKYIKPVFTVFLVMCHEIWKLPKIKGTFIFNSFSGVMLSCIDY